MDLAGPVVLAAFAGGLCALGGALVLEAAVRSAEPVKRVASLLRLMLQAGRAGREPGALERRRLLIGVSLLLSIAGLLAGGVLIGLLIALAGPLAVARTLAWRRERYRAALAQAAPHLALALSDAIAGGHSVRGAIAQARHGLSGPVAIELERVSAELGLGARTEAAIEGLRQRAASHEFDALAAAIVMQRRAGGDLARLLRELSLAFEDNTHLVGEARVATAQARFTGTLVVLLPLGGALLAEAASPGFIGSLFGNLIAVWLLFVAIVLQVVAAVSIRRLSRTGT